MLEVYPLLHNQLNSDCAPSLAVWGRFQLGRTLVGVLPLPKPTLGCNYQQIRGYFSNTALNSYRVR